MIFLFLLMIRMQFVLMEGNFNNSNLLDGISYIITYNIWVSIIQQ